MNPAEINNSARIVIGAVDAYRYGHISSLADVTDKVSNFIKTNENVITTPQKMQVEKLLEKLENSQQKKNTCRRLVNLISGIANQHLIDAKKALNTNKQSLDLNKPLMEKFVGLTTENERFSILKNEHDLSEEHRVEIAKSLARYLGSVILIHFQNFNISNEDSRFEIADLLFNKNSPADVLRVLPNFRLSEERKISFAKKAAASVTSQISDLIMNLGITNKKALFEIICLYAANKEKNTTTGAAQEMIDVIKKLDFSEEERFQITSILVKSGLAYPITEQLQAFRLNQEHRIAIAEKLFQKVPEYCCRYINTFGLKPEDNLRFALIAIRKYPSEFRDNVANFKLIALEQLALARVACEVMCRTWSRFPEQAAALEHRNKPWDDMALSGTEVAGSCQRIGGDVSFNKCLLGYMLDGKNRVIVIKDPKSVEYVDAAGKGVTDGIYTISSSNIQLVQEVM